MRGAFFRQVVLLIIVSLAVPPAAAEAFFFSGVRKKAKTKKKKRRQAKRNAKDGKKRERRVLTQLKLDHPLCSVQAERYLVDRRGQNAIDPVTKEARRFDAAMITRPGGRLSCLFEITSRTADKKAQQAKTARILKRYRKLFVVDKRNGGLVPLRRGILLPTRFKTIRIR